MGWWGYDIMDGDEPCDLREEILDFMFGQTRTDREIMEWVCEQADQELALQVLAYMHVEYKVSLSDDMKEKFIESLENDDPNCFDKPELRQRCVDALLAKIKGE